jgi:3-oxoacyl-[acyl-carrier protein] reductase
MDLSLKGKKAVITGGSRGIGRAIAERLLDDGAAVAICARGKDGVDEAVTALAAGGGQVFGASVDLADGDAVTAWVGEAARQLGGIDIVVSNASAGGGGGASADAFQAHLDIDVLGLVRLVDAALPHLKASEAASIVAISTTAALEQFGPGASAYNSLKAAVINYTAGLAQNLAKDGIRANCVSPGPVFVEGGSWDMIRQHMAPFYDSTVKASPGGRLGTAGEIANVVAFVASPAASWVSGENVVVDGGFTKRVPF